MSVIVRPYRHGGWEVDLRVTLPDESEHRLRLKAPMSSRSAAQRWGEERERHWYHRLTHPQPRRPQGGTHAASVRATLLERPRAGQSSEAERHRSQGNGPARASAAGAGAQAARRDQDRARATTEAGPGSEVAQDGEQRLERAEHHAEEGGGVGRDRSDAVHGEAAAGSKGSTDFYDFDEFERLVEAARLLDPRTHLIILLGGEAGLAVRRDGRAGVDGRGSRERATRGESVGLERACDDAQGWASTSRADDQAIGGGARRASAPAEHARALSGRHEPFTRQIVQTRARRRPRAGVLHGSPTHGRACTFCVTRSARIWRCGARRRARFRSSPGTRIWR